jgi:DNA invertase Pin-like site-specific DNA recombinase
MMLTSTTEKITPRHLEQGAVVYVRQSSPKQLRQNRESQRNQYGLVQRAMDLGWIPQRVRVIDADLGTSGQDGQREGFRDLVAAVSLGRVGLILAYEASRLARSNADWYTLLDLAAVVGTLIADADGVYDPRAYNDRLLLGLRGMLSEAELHWLQLRLEAGRMRQVERGAYRQHVPTGLVRLPDGRVMKDPDQQIEGMISLVFSRFHALGSCQKVLRSLRGDGLLLPRHQTSGLYAGQLVWKKPSDAALYDMLRNPAYAGAFVYGRFAPHPDRRPGQRARRVRRRLEDWPVIRHDAYPAFITWAEFVANQARLSDNASRFTHRTRGAVRQGTALLVGLVVCGRCGRQMRVGYKPQIRYFCSALSQAYGEGSCLNLDGPSVEAAVVRAFFEAIQPAELDVLDEVLAERRADHERVARQHADRVARAAYDVRLARRQYDAVDPDNRLVAGELEHRWELALRAEVEAREGAARFATEPSEPRLDPSLRAQLQDVGRSLPALWVNDRLTAAQKKDLLRALVRRIILTRPRPDTIEIKIVWISGAFSVLEAHPPIWRSASLTDYDRLVARVLELAAAGHQDRAIARHLAAEGFRSARNPNGVTTRLVGSIRRDHGQASLTEQFRCIDMLDGKWTIWGLARALGAHRNWLYKRIAWGTLKSERHPTTGHYLIPDQPGLLEQLRAQLPRGRHS